MQAPPAPRAVPLPAEFPVTWDPPELEFVPWQQDRMHAPNVVAPLAESFGQYFAAGANQAFEELGAPVRFNMRVFNHYYYLGVTPAVPPEQMGPAEMAALPGILGRGQTSAHRWSSEWLPELKRSWEAWSKHDLAAADAPRLRELLAEYTALYQRVWNIHFEMLIPVMLSFSEYLNFAQEHLESGSDLNATRLLQGFDNMSLKAGRGLWALAREAAASPALRGIVSDGDAASVYGRLGESAEGLAFRGKVDAYLREFGLRIDTVVDVGEPSWFEDPSRFFQAMRPYLSNNEDPDVRHAELGREREAAVAAARESLSGASPDVQARFESLLKAAQDCSYLQEDHNHWIDQRSLYESRRLGLAIGAFLAARGQLESAEDALFLSTAELDSALADSSASMASLVRDRRADQAKFATIPAPPLIGTDYGPPPPESRIGMAIGRFWGGPPAAPQESVIQGNPGSGGVYRGVARVLNTIVDAARLDVGEILVAPTTSPPWTPFFATAGAIVTDTGGPLSHCAIVAREYGIPAVVGTGFATQQIRDGQVIEVDGDAGLVRLIAD